MSDVPSAPTAPAAAPASTPASTTSNVTPISGGSSRGAVPATPAGVNPKVLDAKPGEPAAVTEAKKARRLSIKVDGQTEDVDIDSMDDAELTKRLQFAKAAQKRMQEASEIKKQQEAFRERLKKNPVEALKDPEFGVDVRKMIEEQILREYEEQQMDEPTRKLTQQERALAERETKIAEQEAKYAEREQAAINERVFNETKQQFEQALQTGGLPNNQHTISLMAEVAQQHLEAGIDSTPAQLAAEVRERLGQINSFVLKGMKGEQLAKYLGDEQITEVLKYAVERVKALQNKQGYEKPPEAPASGSEAYNPKATANEKRQELASVRRFFRK